MPQPSPTTPSDSAPDETIFAAALQWTTPAERAAYLEEACTGNPELRRRVEELLRASDAAGNFLDHPVSRPQQPAAPGQPSNDIQITLVDDPGEAPGARIGRYKLLQQIGEGGCGTVFMAEQEEPVRRRVALKVIKLGMDTKSVVARFEAERQALALMDHPNIAKVLDAGATDSGRPFFVMELVRGVPITRYCDENKLDTKARLELFIRVCHAIQHAHQKGIIHRDIKPSNILVTLHDGTPVPKVIDFGIAKATEGRLTERTVFTAFEQFIGTPAYMSPEQAEMSGLDIDTRSDIYALGVLLYELLTGRTPFDAKELAKAGLDEIRRRIREVEPPRPSTRLSTLHGDALITTAQAHGTESVTLLSLIQGDLDWIVMKCLEKDRTRRYETANGLAADLKRHLDNEPVTARPPSAAYRFQKAFRRHRLVFAAVAAVAVALLLGMGLSLWQAMRAAREARRAQQAEAQAQSRLAEAEAISKFLTEVFQSPDPARDGRTITVAETLDTAAKKLENDLGDQPDRRARLRVTLAYTFWELGIHSKVIPLLERSLGDYRIYFGPEHTNTIEVMATLAGSYDYIGRLKEGLQLRKEVLEMRQRLFGPEHPDTIRAIVLVAGSYWNLGRQAEAIAIGEKILPIARRVLGPEHATTYWAMIQVAQKHQEAGQPEEALRIVQEAYRLNAKTARADNFTSITIMVNLLDALTKANQAEEAIRLGLPALETSRRVLGPAHNCTLVTMHNLAGAYRGAKRLGEAVVLFEDTLKLFRENILPEHPWMQDGMTNLIACYEALDRRPEAEALRRELAQIRAKTGQSADPSAHPIVAPVPVSAQKP